MALGALQLCACTATGSGVTERVSYGRYEALRIYRPPLPAQHLALLLSGDGGWGSPLDAIASRLAAEGTLVAGIDVRDLFATYEHDGGSCVAPGADLEELVRDLRQRYGLADSGAVLIGHSAGATLAFIALEASSPGSFTGALTLSFCADLD
ncbi:MAG: type IV secretion system protein VirJ, partial [Gammaproteobacteria bacterium]|nr:type IV secretion system protein VirJ [Gammaproteobacteria bacterium]